MEPSREFSQVWHKKCFEGNEQRMLRGHSGRKATKNSGGCGDSGNYEPLPTNENIDGNHLLLPLMSERSEGDHEDANFGVEVLMELGSPSRGRGVWSAVNYVKGVMRFIYAARVGRERPSSRWP